MGSHSTDEFLTSRTINLYPWIRWSPNVVDRVMCVQPGTELCHCSVVKSLLSSVACLRVSGVGVMCDVPAISMHLTDDVLSEENVSEADDNVVVKHATARHLAAADGLLSVLTEAVRRRVIYQAARCHVCLLQQHAADAVSRTSSRDFSLPPSGNSSTNEVVRDDAAMSSCCDRLCQVSTQQPQCSAPSTTSSGQVHIYLFIYYKSHTHGSRKIIKSTQRTATVTATGHD